MPSLRPTRGGRKILSVISELNKVAPSPLPFFGFYIDKLEGCLEEAGCASTILAGIVIILLLYADDIVLLERCPSDLDKQLRLLKDFSSTMGMNVNIEKKK